MPRLRTILLTPVVLFFVFYVVIAIRVATFDNTAPEYDGVRAMTPTIAIFGASGTAGDGILKAAMSDPSVETIHIITRRITPRMEDGLKTGKLVVTEHMDYLDYSKIIDRLSNVDAVYWAIGISSVGMEEDDYRLIHIDFPMQFVEQWLRIARRPEIAFHYVSSSDISEDSSAMWARVKVEAENKLFGLAEGTNLEVIAYRPDYIGPTDEESHLGQEMLYGFFSPVGAAVRAQSIGQAMLEVTSRRDEFSNGDKLSTWRIRRYSDAWEARQ